MESLTGAQALYGKWTKDTSSANLTHGTQVANDEYRLICAQKDWPFLEQFRTIYTLANTQFYPLPYDTDQVREINVQVSQVTSPSASPTTYTPKLSPSRAHWDELNLVAFTSDVPEWYFVFKGQVALWPKPATTGNPINLTIKARAIDLVLADITTITISLPMTATLTNV